MTDKIEVTETQTLNDVKDGILVSRGRLRVTLVSRVIGSEQLRQRMFCKASSSSKRIQTRNQLFPITNPFFERSVFKVIHRNVVVATKIFRIHEQMEAFTLSL
jgi:hypothetical protein